jgi:hypothetical protein
MRLARPFFQLPVLFEAARLQAEVAALPDEAWVPHPDGVAGNSAVRLISVGGGESDGVQGEMLATRWLAAMPYARQLLAGFGVVWGRSRLMRLAPGAGVPEHADINYHWHMRVRLHVPVFTQPPVRFHCDGESVHMAAGEAWVFDNWRRHHVDNPSDAARVHLVADTSGTAAFWQFACADPPPRALWPTARWNPQVDARPLTEINERMPIMPAAEVQLLVEDLCAELASAARDPEAEKRTAQFRQLMQNFLFDWRQLCALHGLSGRGQPEFARLADGVRVAARPLAEGLVMKANGASAMLVLEKRVLQHLVAAPGAG